jgi:hypothetical protein
MRFIAFSKERYMTGFGNAVLWAAMIVSLVLSERAIAVELTGAWASGSEKYNKVFARRGRAS